MDLNSLEKLRKLSKCVSVEYYINSNCIMEDIGKVVDVTPEFLTIIIAGEKENRIQIRDIILIQTLDPKECITSV